MRSSDGRPNLVIRSHSPTRRLIFIGAILLIAALALYIVYEYGRFNAGYDRLAAAQQRTELEVEIERLNKSNRELRTHLAELDTIRIGRAREQAEVTRTISDLQDEQRTLKDLDPAKAAATLNGLAKQLAAVQKSFEEGNHGSRATCGRAHSTGLQVPPPCSNHRSAAPCGMSDAYLHS